ncbi:MAG: glycosyltransferase family 4 protein [Patescibacteria group bacterium]
MVERDQLRVAINTPYPLRKNRPDGVTQFIVGLKPHLADKGCLVRTIGPHIKDKENNAADYTLGRTTVKLPFNNTVFESGYSFNKDRAEGILRAARPDVLVIHEPLAGHIAHTLISGCPRNPDGKLIPTVIGHNHAHIEWVNRKTNLVIKLIKRVKRPRRNGHTIELSDGYFNTIFDSMDGRIAVSKATADFWNKRYPCDNQKVIYNGIDTSSLTPEGPTIAKWNDGKQTILFCGRHDPRKGIEYLIKAYALLRTQRDDIKLKITGEGQTTEKLYALVDELQVPDVEFLGILPRENASAEVDLIRAYRSAKVFVSPATGGEGFGRTLAEALACGTLPVGTDIDGYREVIGGRPFARSARPANPNDLAIKIVDFLDMPEEERSALQAQGRQYVEDNFSWPKIAEETVLYYEELVKKHGKSIWPQKKRKGL